MQNYDIPLHDIKPILEIQEYSMFYLIALALVALFLVFGTLYLLYKWMKNRNRYNVRKEHLRLINELDLSQTKESAYLITSYGFTFKDDSPRHTQMYENLTQRLDEYKYKKEVEGFDEEVLAYIELYKGMLDVR